MRALTRRINHTLPIACYIIIFTQKKFTFCVDEDEEEAKCKLVYSLFIILYMMSLLLAAVDCERMFGLNFSKSHTVCVYGVIIF